MLISKSYEHGIVLAEVRLCCQCKRMFCLNTNNYFHFTMNGLVFHRHETCPPLKEGFATKYKLLGE